MKIGVIILARANFGRWPDKVLFELAGKTILEHVIIKSKKLHVDTVIISTTNSQEDQVIRNIAQKQGVKISTDEPDDRTARYCKAIEDYKLDYFLPLPASAPFFDVKYQNIVLDCIKDNPEFEAYSLAAKEVYSFVGTIYSSKLPQEMLTRTDRDQEFFGDTWVKEFYLMDGTSEEIKNRWIFNANIAYKIEARNQREICEHLGHFPVDYEEIIKALMEIEL